MPKSENKQKTTPIEVRFFGSFHVGIAETVITESSSRAKRPWSLLQYLMVHRNKTVAKQQLIDALWPEDSSDQPEKALKNLVYRVRSNFAASNLPFAQDVILYRGGNYQLNNELHWQLDFEQFEEAYNKMLKPNIESEQSIQYGMQAIELYQGDFLAEQAYEDWVLPYNNYYKAMLFKCVAYVLQQLEDSGRDADIELVCSRALVFDQFEESLHLSYMNALIRQGKKAMALNHYNKMADMFYREFGVTPNEELRELYKELSNSLNSAETDLHTIKDALCESDVTNDAFYCDFEVFRNLYRLEARAAERAGQAVFVGLLTLQHAGDGALEGEALNKSMSILLEAVHYSLRRGDVVSRFSVSQYILMLPTITMENAEMVLKRVADRFDRGNQHQAISLSAKIQPLDPVMM